MMIVACTSRFGRFRTTKLASAVKVHEVKRPARMIDANGGSNFEEVKQSLHIPPIAILGIRIFCGHQVQGNTISSYNFEARCHWTEAY